MSDWSKTFFYKKDPSESPPTVTILDDSDEVFVDDDLEFKPPKTRIRKDSFRITQVVDSGPKLSDATIDEMEENPDHPELDRNLRARLSRIGSVDSGLKTTSKIMHLPAQKQSQIGWKQLNEGLNHIFPNKKNSMEKLLRKSSSRTSLYDGETSEDEVYHTVHGTSRKNTLVVSRNLDPFSKITRRRNGETELPQVTELLSNASSNHSLNNETLNLVIKNYLKITTPKRVVFSMSK